MKTTCYKIALFLCCLPFLALSQATIKGKIVDINDQLPLIAANVTVGDKGATSDMEGNYTITLASGTYTIVASYIGYQSVTKEVTIAVGETKEVNFELEIGNNMLQTATVTSGKFEKPLGEVTVSLEVIKPQLLDNTNTVTVNQVLEKVPSVNVIDGQANIRGGSGYSYGAGSRVLLLVDDLPALQGDAGFPNWNFVPVENIEQIEVVKGAASALYGSSAMNGIINIRQAYPKSEPYTQISTFTTTYDSPADPAKKWWSDTTTTPFSAGVSFAHRQKFNKFDLVLGGYTLYHNDFKKGAFQRFARINANTRYRISDKMSVGVNINFQKGRSANFFLWENDTTGAYKPMDGTISNNDNYRILIDPFLTFYDKNDGRHKIMTRYYRVDNTQGNDINDQSLFSNIFYGEYQYQTKIKPADLTLTAGIVGNYINTEAAIYGDSSYTSSNAAVYLQLDKKIGRLNIALGLRGEQNKITSPTRTFTEAKPVFRLGLNYQAADYTYFRASFGQGYRFPTIAEKYVSTCVSGQLCIYANPDLVSETGWTTEFGLKQGFKISSFQGFVDIAAFWMQYNNMMEFTFGRYGTNADPLGGLGFASQNIGNTDIRGIDASIAGRGDLFGLPTTLLAGYTYLVPTFQDFDSVNLDLLSIPENVLKYRFEHIVKFDMETTFDKFSIGFAVLYNSFMRNIDAPFEVFINGLANYRANNPTGSAVVNTRIAYRPAEKIKISMVTKNLFNAEYAIRPALLEAPRNFSLRIDYNF